jgi:uncharacterized membrane protein YedE/YeeE
MWFKHPLLRLAITGSIGLLFGLGLLLSGMANPHKVMGFLDIAGSWDPSLAVVMLGAITIGSLGFAWAKRHRHALLGTAMQLPQATHIDKPLIIGALLFGCGWGLAGYCPGTAWVAMANGQYDALIFIVAMLVGMRLYRWFDAARAKP